VTLEVSRTTIGNYLAVREATFVVHALRPYASRPAQEIVSAPKVYAFDTGFVCAPRGWTALRHEDLGQLWEHYVLNELHARLQTRRIRYWRNKRGAEVDFVLVPRRAPPIAIECKWSSSGIEMGLFKAIRLHYPEGPNYVVCSDIDRPSTHSEGDLCVRRVGLPHLIDDLRNLGDARLQS
jgi:uncharacterized protein